MGGFSIWHWLIVGILVLLLFGKGRFSDMMGDVAKGIKSFKKGMSEDDAAPQPMKHIDGQRAPDAPPAPTAMPTNNERDPA
jgi:sec-independent protein translocase protein TatA